jgi:hypothetical protein
MPSGGSALIMEDSMPARTTRKEARARLLRTIMAAVDRIIPEDESRPLRGSTFADWEDQTDAFKQAVIPTILEERSALEANAEVAPEQLGRCPFCGSDSVRLRTDPIATPEVITPDGPAAIPVQRCRCRQCGRSFSPSAS